MGLFNHPASKKVIELKKNAAGQSMFVISSKTNMLYPFEIPTFA